MKWKTYCPKCEHDSELHRKRWNDRDEWVSGPPPCRQLEQLAPLLHKDGFLRLQGTIRCKCTLAQDEIKLNLRHDR